MSVEGSSVSLRQLFEVGTVAGLTDAQLLQRFLTRRDEAAFEALVRKLGPMVLAVCRRRLSDPNDVDDAFQATFLVLIRRAPDIQDPGRLANWVYGVAHKVAERARVHALRRRERERKVPPMSAEPDPAPELDDFAAPLHEEIRALPDRYRSAIVVCFLQGRTHEEAARDLGWPVGTVKGRLARAKDLLRKRLVRRGFTAPAGLLASTLAKDAAGSVPPALLVSTIRAALPVAAGEALTAAAVSTSAAALAQEVAQAMIRHHVTLLVLGLAALGLIGGGAGVYAWQGQKKPQGGDDSPIKAPRQPSEAVLPEEKPPITHPITVKGQALAPDGKPVTGAHVYLASLTTYQRIAETTSDQDGLYQFRDVPLPIKPRDPKQIGGRDHGTFLVFGEAKGFGFTWLSEKWFYPHPRPSNVTYYEPDWPEASDRFEADDRIVLDLKFAPAAHLSGRIVDDRGNPLPDVQLGIWDCESLGFSDVVSQGRTISLLHARKFDMIRDRRMVPDSMRVRTTDADGRFEFTGLPEGYLFRLQVRAKDYPNRWVYAATSQEPQPPEGGAPVLTGEINLTLASSVEVPIQIAYGDTGKPAPRVLAQAIKGLENAYETSDDQGRVLLKLAPGTYQMQYLPEYGTPYLVTESEIQVGKTPPEGPYQGDPPPRFGAGSPGRGSGDGRWSPGRRSLATGPTQ